MLSGSNWRLLLLSAIGLASKYMDDEHLCFVQLHRLYSASSCDRQPPEVPQAEHPRANAAAMNLSSSGYAYGRLPTGQCPAQEGCSGSVVLPRLQGHPPAARRFRVSNLTREQLERAEAALLRMLDWRVAFDGDELTRQEKQLAEVAEQVEREAEQAEKLLEQLAQPHHEHALPLCAHAAHAHGRVLSAADEAFLQKRRRWSTPAAALAPGSEEVTAPTPPTTHRDRCCRTMTRLTNEVFS